MSFFDIFRNATAAIASPLLAVAVLTSTQCVATLAQDKALQPAGTRSAKHTPFQPNHYPMRADMYYQGVWGIDSLVVRSTEAGELIRFSFRVLDPVRAKQLNDKSIEPSLIDYKAGVKLQIPQLEKVGKLRQTSDPEAGRKYWMAFSNPGGTVRRGDRVSIVIGNFHAEGLVVE